MSSKQNAKELSQASTLASTSKKATSRPPINHKTGQPMYGPKRRGEDEKEAQQEQSAPLFDEVDATQDVQASFPTEEAHHQEQPGPHQSTTSSTTHQAGPPPATFEHHQGQPGPQIGATSGTNHQTAPAPATFEQHQGHQHQHQQPQAAPVTTTSGTNHQAAPPAAPGQHHQHHHQHNPYGQHPQHHQHHHQHQQQQAAPVNTTTGTNQAAPPAPPAAQHQHHQQAPSTTTTTTMANFAPPAQSTTSFAPPQAQQNHQQPPPPAAPAQAQRSYMSVAFSAADNRPPLRVPAWAVEAIGASVVPLLPFGISHLLGKDDPTVIYAVRLQDSYTDLRAVMKGERSYVLYALKQAMEAYVIPSACKDPTLVIKGFSSSPPLRPNLTFLKAPSHALTLVGNIAIPEEKFWCIQARRQNDESHSHPLYEESVEQRYKKYRILPVGPGVDDPKRLDCVKAVRKGIFYAMPRDAITSSIGFSKMVTFKVKKESNIEALTTAIINNIPATRSSDNERCINPFGMLHQSVGVARVLLTKDVTEETFNYIAETFQSYCYEISSDDDRFKWTPAPDNNSVVIKRTDNNPITNSAFETIKVALPLLKPILVAGAVFAILKNAKDFHECTVGPWAILWRGAELRQPPRVDPGAGLEEM